MWQHVSLCRDHDGLLEARRKIQVLQQSLPVANVANVMLEAVSPRMIETTNMLLVAELVIAAALERGESRGSHWRLDYQSPVASLAGHHYVFQHSDINPGGLEPWQKEVVPHA
jgi:L-aspartate oxidase